MVAAAASQRSGCPRELGAGLKAPGEPGTLHPFLFQLRTPSPGQSCEYPLLFSPILVAGGFLFFISFIYLFFSDSGGEERGERVSVRPESKRERQEPQVYGNVETAGELCHQTTLLHLSTCEAWLERLLGAGSDARAPCALWAGWGGVEPGVEG